MSSLQMTGDDEDIRPDQYDDVETNVQHGNDDEDLGDLPEDLPNLTMGRHTQSTDSISNDQVT